VKFLSALYKKIQLFWLGFMLALGLMLGVAVRNGDVNIAEYRAKFTQYSFDYVQKNPEALERVMGYYSSVFGDPTAPAGSPSIQNGKLSSGVNSLSALKNRQAQQVFTPGLQ
jgi:hypothetical protein